MDKFPADDSFNILVIQFVALGVGLYEPQGETIVLPQRVLQNLSILLHFIQSNINVTQDEFIDYIHTQLEPGLW